jgi:hypothetical protein
MLLMPDPAPDPRENQILDALPGDVRYRIFPHMELTKMPLGTVLYEPDDELRHVYFPIDSRSIRSSRCFT